jgi:hypothetical protein
MTWLGILLEIDQRLAAIRTPVTTPEEIELLIVLPGKR